LISLSTQQSATTLNPHSTKQDDGKLYQFLPDTCKYHVVTKIGKITKMAKITKVAKTRSLGLLRQDH